MTLELNGAALGPMAIGTYTDALKARPGANTVRFLYGQTNKVEGVATLGPRETGMVVACAKGDKSSAPGSGSASAGSLSPFQIFSCKTGVKVDQPQFYMVSALRKTTNLVVDGKSTRIEPMVETRIGTEGRIKIQTGETILLDLDATAPACMDGPMKWLLFLYDKPNQPELHILTVADFPR